MGGGGKIAHWSGHCLPFLKESCYCHKNRAKNNGPLLPVLSLSLNLKSILSEQGQIMYVIRFWKENYISINIRDTLVINQKLLMSMVVKVLIQKRSYTWSRLIKTQHLWDFPQKIVWQVQWSKKPRITEIWIGSLVGLAAL